MSTFADAALYPDGIIVWLVVGLVAGWFVGLVMKGSAYGINADINLGLVGAVIAGCFFGLVVTGGEWFGSIAVAFVGACVSIALVRFTVPAPAALNRDRNRR
jgi:uncharacterized membrane protein YeaQ/YmgE (transglycosylase-associated protein family)